MKLIPTNISFREPKFTLKGLFISLTLSAFSFHVLAENKVDVSGFISTGVSRANRDNSFLQTRYNIEHRTSYLSGSVLGLQIDYRFDAKIKSSIQLLADNKQNDYQINAEWYYLSYQYNPNVTFRAGRLRMPIYRVSETIYVGRSYTWLRPPLEVYSLFNSITRFNGFDALYDAELGTGLVSVQGFLGQAKETIYASGQELGVNTQKLYGLVFNYEIEDFNFRFQSSDMEVVATNDVTGQEPNQITFTNFGVDYHAPAFGVLSEFVKMHLSNVKYLTVDPGPADVYAGYVTLTRSIGKLTPYLTFGKTEAEGFYGTNTGSSTTIGFRYDNNNAVATKFSIFRGNAGDQFLILSTGSVTLDEYQDDVTVVSLAFSHNF